ncbi:MAG: metallophosphoesterase [Bryobacteraceae bacterium]
MKQGKGQLPKSPCRAKHSIPAYLIDSRGQPDVLFDYCLIVIFACVQWRISVLCLRAARRRIGQRRLAWLRAAVLALDGLIAFGYSCTFYERAAQVGIPGWLAAPLGGATTAYLMAATGALAVYEVLRRIGHQLGADTDPTRRRILQAGGSAVLAVPFAALGYGVFIERLNFRVREVEVPLAVLPGDLDGLRVLQLSDIHLSPFLSETDLARVVDASRELRPHLAVVTGDLISSRGDPLDACIRQLARLKSDAGVFGCMGNHERYVGGETYTAAAAGRVGIEFLRQRSRQLRFGGAILNLAGVDYQKVGERKLYLKGAERLIVPGAANVLLSHNPDVFPVAAHQGYHLVMAGHTHGGQVAVEILDQSINAARFFTPYVYGLYGGPRAAVWVTRGIGTIALPARIGAPPEIAVLRLRKA